MSDTLKDIKPRISDEESKRQMYYVEQLKPLVKEMSDKAGHRLTAHVTTFGCQMNARDSEKLTAILKLIGYEIAENEDADFIIFNTCTVRENANQKVYGHLGKLKHEKKKNPNMMVGICGCMMQEPDVVDTIKKNYSFVDVIFGTYNIFKFAEILYNRITSGQPIIDIWQSTDRIVEDLPSLRKFSFKAGVNITFGCDNFCTYCIVPYVRGRERSREPEAIIREIKDLVADGVVEVMLLGQNVNSYGKGLENPVTFAELLSEVADIPGLKRVRFMTSHPKDLSDDLIRVMAQKPNICRHFHLPLQSGSSRILKSMNRHYTKEQYLVLVEKLRKAMPDISITTDIIVGYPGETDEDFRETLDVVRKARFDAAFTFEYSPRTGTPAAKLEPVDKRVVRERFNELLSTVNEISREQVKRFEGRTMEVLVEGMNSQDENLVTGRISNNVLVHFPGTSDDIGKLMNVRLSKSCGFYYMGERA